MRWLCAFCLLPALAAAQPSAAIYDDADPQAPMKRQIEALMGVYLVDPPRRHESERVHVHDGQVRVEIWHPVGSLSDAEIKTRAVRWFVYGRTQYAPGVPGVFSELPAVREVILVFHDVTRLDQTGRRKSNQADRVKKYLAIKLTRKKFDRLNMRVLAQCAAQGDCSRSFEIDFSKSSFDARYTASQRSEDQ